MDSILLDKLHLLEAKNAGKKSRNAQPRLKVYYGWSRLNKVQKKEAIAVFFENEAGAGSETKRSYKTMQRLVDVVAERYQTKKEMQDAALSNRVFTVYLIFLKDKAVKGSLEQALRINSDADRFQVSEKERKEIADKLRQHYLDTHPGYKEPERQLELEF